VNQYDPRTTGYGQATRAEIDEGLRSYMLRVYNYMCLGVVFTGIVSMLMLSQPQLMYAIMGTPLKWVIFAAIFGFGFFSKKLFFSDNQFVGQVAFFGYAGLWGVWVSPMLLMYLSIDPALVYRAFFITAAMFAGMSLFGYTTKKQLSGMGQFLAMAAIGLFLAILANVFIFQSSFMQLILSGGMVLVFAGITAWETQEVKNMYAAAHSVQANNQKGVFGAYLLYGTFMIMFIYILQIFGIMGGDD
jgi:FtsH-binding integral membrane protein